MKSLKREHFHEGNLTSISKTFEVSNALGNTIH